MASMYDELYDSMLQGHRVTLHANGQGVKPNPNSVRTELARRRAAFVRATGGAESRAVRLQVNADGSLDLWLERAPVTPGARFTVHPIQKESQNGPT